MIKSSYIINDQGLYESSPNIEHQGLPAAFITNANFEVYTNKFSIGLKLFNLTNKKYYLPTAISKTQRQFAEARMIYLHINYFLKK